MNSISNDKKNFLKYINMGSNISHENCSRNMLSLGSYLHLIILKYLSVAHVSPLRSNLFFKKPPAGVTSAK